MDRRRNLCGRNSGICFPDRAHTGSYVSYLWRDAGIWSGNDLYGDPGNSTEMVSGPHRICFRCCGNCQRTLRIFPGAAEPKTAGSGRRAENPSDRWRGHHGFLDPVRHLFSGTGKEPDKRRRLWGKGRDTGGETIHIRRDDAYKEFLSSPCDHVLWTDLLFYGFTSIPDLSD